MTDHGIAEARAAKELLAQQLSGNPAVRGIGVAPRGAGYVVKVNVDADGVATVVVPDEIDGVPIVVEVVGDIRAQ